MNRIDSQIKYPIGVQSFSKIREGGFLYIDKTSILYRLLHTDGYYFLSRPRRFGKSLMLSTIEAYYQGRRELFKGLALDSLTDDWDPHPVLHLDLNAREYIDRDSVVAQLNLHLELWEARYDCAKPDRSPEERFGNVIRNACERTGKKVVILIDEYDKPLLSAVNDEELADSYRSLLKAFYGNLKSLDPYIENAFITGVARFSKVSIFSDLNNLRDISFEDEFSNICGITPDELDSYFKVGISQLAEKENLSEDDIHKQLRANYDGYHFSKRSKDIYNPFSLMNVFAKMDMGSFWFDSATPTFLVDLIKEEKWLLRDLAPIEIEAKRLESAGLLGSDPIPVLYQSGYLTIKDYDPIFKTYTLDYPNEEVRESFISYLVPFYIEKKESSGRFSVKKFVNALYSGNIDHFMKMLESMIAGVPYSEKGSAEAHFQNACYLLFTLMGQYVKIEDRTSDGRIDLSVETSRYIYIFEFKINESAENAIEQIFQKKYWLKYQTHTKEIILIGANFDTNTRRITAYLVERPYL